METKMKVIMRTVLITLILMTVLIAGCSSEPSSVLLSPTEFKELIQDPDVFVLDVHVPEQEHIAGTDAVLPFDGLDQFPEELPADKSTKIAIYCRSGSMSSYSASTLRDMGYTNIYDLKGGRNAYVREFGE